MIKGSIQEEDITNINIYALSIGTPQYIRQILTTIKGKIDSNMVIVGDFNNLLTSMDRSSRQKINKETQASHDTLDGREIQPVHPKVNQLRIFIGRTDVEAEVPILWPLDAKN